MARSSSMLSICFDSASTLSFFASGWDLGGDLAMIDSSVGIDPLGGDLAIVDCSVGADGAAFLVMDLGWDLVVVVCSKGDDFGGDLVIVDNSEGASSAGSPILTVLPGNGSLIGCRVRESILIGLASLQGVEEREGRSSASSLVF